MANSLTRGVFTLGLLLIGIATTIYAAGVAYDGSDQTHEVVSALHPVFETAVWALPFVVLVVVAISLVGGVAWLRSQANVNGGGRR